MFFFKDKKRDQIRKVCRSHKIVRLVFGGGKLIGPLLIGLGLPIEVAPLRASTSEILNLASIASYSSGVIDYSN